MLIIGAKGLAKELLEIFHKNNELDNLVFYDDINEDELRIFYKKFPILKNIEEAKEYFFKHDNSFTIGIGNPFLRKKMYHKFSEIGGKFKTTISKHAIMSSYDTVIGEGCNILAGSIFSNSIVLGRGCLIYYNAVVTHDCLIGDFVEISPGAKILGGVQIGNYCQLGANSIILPKVKIGNNVIVGAGAVVTKNLPDNCVAVGVPAKIIKQ